MDDDEIRVFEIVDLGVAPVGTFDPWGPAHREVYDSVMLGEGPTAKAAVECALNELALEGYSTRLLHESAVEHGFHSPSASQQASSIWADCCAEGDDQEAEVLYYVGIRYQDPFGDEDDEDDEDNDNEGNRTIDV